MGLHRYFQILCDECGEEGPDGYLSSYVQNVAHHENWSFSPKHGWRCPDCNGRNRRLYGDD
jgi:hypothetical protein